jgi:DNA-binding NtrC family response regulator
LCERADEFAQRLYDAMQAKVPTSPLTDDEPGMTLEDGYAVQQGIVRRMLDANPFGARAGAPGVVVRPTETVTTSADAEELTLDDLERRHIERLLQRHRNVTRVAEILGINRRTLQRKLRGYGLDAGPG